MLTSDKNYLVITWDLNTTGRRLNDEICHIGAYYKSGDEEFSYSQYVMPHKSPDLGAVKRYHLQVYNYGRYRVLMDTETGTYLKTKSEYTALSGFMDWLQDSSKGTDGVILVYHESARKILVPLLLDALNKYKFLPRFREIVKGVCNGVSVVDTHGNKEKITSYSLRSLSKTVLNDTNPKTTSTIDRCSILYQILSSVSSEATETSLASAVSPLSFTITEEEAKLTELKAMLSSQNTLRPIFQSMFTKKRVVREQALSLRKIVVDAKLDYAALEEIYKAEAQDTEKTAEVLTKRLEGFTPDEESLNALLEVLHGHFVPSKGGNKKKKGKAPKEKSEEEGETSSLEDEDEDKTPRNEAQLADVPSNNNNNNESVSSDPPKKADA
eukprot:TRINITY_DN813_c0_g2_i1.p1 TRINITY_DN813_c0_g2~~TRINITY_DN813_c0_g2_i1.p1  ORF type:complete len:383 (+),score=130.85 TRINITY_DN813_c0_g2_i1:203-1351(+)